MAVGPCLPRGGAEIEPLYLSVAAPPPGLQRSELPMLLPGGLGMTVSSELQKLPAAAPDYGRPRKGGLKAAKWMKPRLMAEEESSSRGRQQSDTRWWTKLQEQLLCPLSGFPIRLLPYPPFKLRVDCSKPGPHFLLDGKFLAMKLIVDGRPGEGIRDLETSDLLALDDYIQRCKLGPFRPGTARALQQEIATAKTESDRIRAVEELKKMQQRTKTKLGKLRRIQDNRLSQLKTDLKVHSTLDRLPGQKQHEVNEGQSGENASVEWPPAEFLLEEPPHAFLARELEKSGAEVAGRFQL